MGQLSALTAAHLLQNVQARPPTSKATLGVIRSYGSDVTTTTLASWRWKGLDTVRRIVENSPLGTDVGTHSCAFTAKLSSKATWGLIRFYGSDVTTTTRASWRWKGIDTVRRIFKNSHLGTDVGTHSCAFTAKRSSKATWGLDKILR